MTYIRIPLPLVIAVMVALVLAAVGAQYSEMKRYLKVKAM